MKALITGANGFIGTNLVKRLQAEGWSLRILVRKESRLRHSLSDGVEIVTVDYSDYTTLIEPVKGIDVIFHLAGITKGLDRKHFRSANVMPLENLCRAITESGAKPGKLVFSSSLTAGGPAINCELPNTEKISRPPIDLYGESKLAAEEVLKKYGDTVPHTILRLAAVFGPWDVDFLVLFKQLYGGLNLYFGDKYKYVNALHVEDVLNALKESAINKNAHNQLYYIGHDHSFTWQMIHNSILRAAGRKGFEVSIPFFVAKAVCTLGSAWMRLSNKPVLLNSEKIKLSKPRYWACSNQKAKTELGFNPAISIEEGMRRTMEWYVDNGWLKAR